MDYLEMELGLTWLWTEYHLYCLQPPLTKLPEGDWFCPSCRPQQPSPETNVEVGQTSEPASAEAQASRAPIKQERSLDGAASQQTLDGVSGEFAATTSAGNSGSSTSSAPSDATNGSAVTTTANPGSALNGNQAPSNNDGGASSTAPSASVCFTAVDAVSL